MDEYIERATALKFILGLTIVDPVVEQYANAVCYHLQNLPAADVVHVVRCRECKHYKPEEYFSPCVLPQGIECAKPDDFCSYGKRKEDA